jgi:sugar phosphate isomerase/epimerase
MQRIGYKSSHGLEFCCSWPQAFAWMSFSRKVLHSNSPSPFFSRREALRILALSGSGACMAFSAEANLKRKLKINLMCGMIGVRANQFEAVDLAHKHGFESVEPMPHDLARLSEAELNDLRAAMRQKNIVFGAAGLPVDFRQDDARFIEGMKSLPKLAAALEKAGVTRTGTWLTPGSNTLTYRQNFRRCSERLRQVANILAGSNIRLGLEYVGPKTSRDRYRFHFIYTLLETKELIAEIGSSNIGFVLDSWHWWNANDTVEDILTLRGEEVIAVDLNDAPAGIPKEKQLDGQRELPMATGVIDVKAFLSALVQIGCDAPVRAEPFNKALNDLNNDEACAKTSASLHKAFDLIS